MNGEDAWDCRELDLVIGARTEATTIRRAQPAALLINAWHAGVPALAGAEPAFNDLRRSSLDFAAVRGPGDMLRTIDFLREHPGVYHAMVANGASRARSFTAPAIEDRWLAFLAEEVAPDARRWIGAGVPARWYRAQALAALARQKVESRIYALRIELERGLERGLERLPLRALG